MPSQGDSSGDLNAFDWAREYIREKYAKPGEVYIGLVHRIDRPTGGILVLARTSKAAARISKLFQDKKVQKVYYAVTERIPDQPQGELKHFLKKITDRNIMRAYDKELPHSQPASLQYRVLKTAGNRALLEVLPKTGRRHQIRVQLAAMGCTIVGDVKYGKTDFLPDQSIALFAKRIRFQHPNQGLGEVEFEAPLPQKAPWSDFG
ncbi:MAG: RNA pseudouridine synthase [Bacteroidia bacterium]|nr:RNA pseudouridine synthase [Bacteroidia bacterium]